MIPHTAIFGKPTSRQREKSFRIESTMATKIINEIRRNKVFGD